MRGGRRFQRLARSMNAVSRTRRTAVKEKPAALTQGEGEGKGDDHGAKEVHTSDRIAVRVAGGIAEPPQRARLRTPPDRAGIAGRRLAWRFHLGCSRPSARGAEP